MSFTHNKHFSPVAETYKPPKSIFMKTTPIFKNGNLSFAFHFKSGLRLWFKIMLKSNIDTVHVLELILLFLKSGW